VLRRRQPDLTVVLENVHDPHNVSAVLRSCDAVGIAKVHLVYSDEDLPSKSLARTTSASATKWVTVERHATIEECYEEIRGFGMHILVTAFGESSKDLYEMDFTSPTALVFGNEHRGCSESAIGGADGKITIPMMGMVQSLNISTACAVVLYEAMRQRRLDGQYNTSKVGEDELARRAEEWLQK
jgi:tRNA (guanosine-2'-O-)-methyltransferase